MLLRLAHLGVTGARSMLRLLPMGDHAKDVEILALHHRAPPGATEPCGGERPPPPSCRSRVVKLGAA